MFSYSSNQRNIAGESSFLFGFQLCGSLHSYPGGAAYRPAPGLSIRGKAGRPIGDLATDLLDPHPWVRYRFLADLGLTPGDDGYTDRLYHLEITAVHVRSHNAIIVCRPWLRAAAWAAPAGSSPRSCSRSR